MERGSQESTRQSLAPKTLFQNGILWSVGSCSRPMLADGTSSRCTMLTMEDCPISRGESWVLGLTFRFLTGTLMVAKCSTLRQEKGEQDCSLKSSTELSLLGRFRFRTV